MTASHYKEIMNVKTVPPDVRMVKNYRWPNGRTVDTVFVAKLHPDEMDGELEDEDGPPS